MKVSIIVANSENGVIGNNGKLPWKLSADLENFKNITTGHYVIMGRKTYESIGYSLPNRDNLVISKDAFYGESKNKIAVFTSVKFALEYVERWEDFTGFDQQAFIIGGQEIFEIAMNEKLVDTIYQTVVHSNIEGDTFFKIKDSQDWELSEMKRYPSDKNNQYGYSFFIWKKKSISSGVN